MKMPIMRPAIEAVLFGFERIGMVVRIAWLPIVICIGLFVAAFAMLVGVAGVEHLHDAAGDPEDMMAAIMASPGFMTFYALQFTVMPIVVALILSGVYVAVTRASTLADYEPPNLPFYFAVGPREIRYVIARILYAIILGLTMMAIAIPAAGIAFAAVSGVEALDGDARALVIAPAVGLGLWLILIWLWVLVRLLPVLPIAAVENRIAFGDAWKMTKGNFWRLLFSGAMFLAIFQGVLSTLMFVLILPAVVIVGLIVGLAAGFVGPAALVGLGVLVLLLIPVIVVLAAFSLAAQAAYPARVYAYLSGCGDDCKI